ncbi:hypothetical protein HDU93_001832, partial [Gonapodya sp. JEL0774]
MLSKMKTDNKGLQRNIAAPKSLHPRSFSLVNVEDPRPRLPNIRSALPILHAPKSPSRTPVPTVASYTRLADKWDRGNRPSREVMLVEFVKSSKGKTADQLDRDFAGGASLFLTRISAWLRLT